MGFCLLVTFVMLMMGMILVSPQMSQRYQSQFNSLVCIVCSECWQTIKCKCTIISYEKTKINTVTCMKISKCPPISTHTQRQLCLAIGTNSSLIISLFFSWALWLHMPAVKLISPPTNPSILMLVHIRLGRIKLVINDVLIGLFSTTEPRCWVDNTLAYLSHPACQGRMFSCREIKARYILEMWGAFYALSELFCFLTEHSDWHQKIPLPIQKEKKKNVTVMDVSYFHVT